MYAEMMKESDYLKQKEVSKNIYFELALTRVG